MELGLGAMRSSVPRLNEVKAAQSPVQRGLSMGNVLIPSGDPIMPIVHLEEMSDPDGVSIQDTRGVHITTVAAGVVNGEMRCPK